MVSIPKPIQPQSRPPTTETRNITVPFDRLRTKVVLGYLEFVISEKKMIWVKINEMPLKIRLSISGFWMGKKTRLATCPKTPPTNDRTSTLGRNSRGLT